MAETSDGVAEDIVVVQPTVGRSWTIPGGEEDDDSVTLHVVVVAGTDRRYYSVVVPLAVEDGQLSVGAPTVEEHS